jgi:hypothetical protein
MKTLKDQVNDLSLRACISKKQAHMILLVYFELLSEYVLEQDEITLNNVGKIKYKPYKVTVNSNFGDKKCLGVYSGKMPHLSLHKIYRMTYQKRNCTVVPKGV